MINHINVICKSCFYHLHNIWRIRTFLSLDSTKALVQSAIMARIDYSNSLLVGVQSVYLSQLQRLQNAAGRMVMLSPRHSHITPILFNLHWLPASYIIDYKIALYTFKSIYALAPKYFCDLVHVKAKSGHRL